MRARTQHGNPRIFGVRLTMLLHICLRRLRQHTGQELLAGSGIAVGVALVFGVLIANTSLTGSAGELVRQVVGDAQLQLVARTPGGLDEQEQRAARYLPGVRASAVVLRDNVVVAGPHGQRSLQLLGVTQSVVRLHALGTSNFGPEGFHAASGLVLPEVVARAIGVQPGEPATVLAGGLVSRKVVGAVLNASEFGALASSPVVAAPLTAAQGLTGLAGRATLVLVEPRAGAYQVVARELRRVAGGRLDVVPADNELRLLEEAVKPSNQATFLFAALGMMVGFLLAICATLFTVPERRRFIADLRMEGFDWRQVILIAGCEALLLGVGASLVGVALGYGLSSWLFHRTPAYLVSAFPIPSRQLISAWLVLLSIGCGVFATWLALLPLVGDLRPNRARDAVYRSAGAGSETVSQRTIRLVGGTSLALAVVTTLVVAWVPSLTLVGGVALALVVIGLIPALFAVVARVMRVVGERVRGGAMVVAMREVGAVSMRSVAVAGIGALAVYGSLAVGGAQRDVLHGLDEAIVQEWSTAQVWITPDSNIFDADSFHLSRAQQAALGRTPGVVSVLAHQGAFLDIGRHRVWIRAAPPNGSSMILSSQLLKGNYQRATALLRAGGWATVSSGFADERRLHIGDYFTLPTPSGAARFGVAAITTNIGWPSGAITLNTTDFSRLWQTSDPTTLAVRLAPGVSATKGKQLVERALGFTPALRVQTAKERIAEVEGIVGEGLRTLSDIAHLLIIASALAVAAAIGAAIWQRRPRLASLKVHGYDRRQLLVALLIEGTIVLAVGCADGALLGLYGHALASRALELATGFPAPFAIDPAQVALTLGLLSGVALGIITLPGVLAARVPAHASFQE